MNMPDNKQYRIYIAWYDPNRENGWYSEWSDEKDSFVPMVYNTLEDAENAKRELEFFVNNEADLIIQELEEGDLV